MAIFLLTLFKDGSRMQHNSLYLQVKHTSSMLLSKQKKQNREFLELSFSKSLQVSYLKKPRMQKKNTNKNRRPTMMILHLEKNEGKQKYYLIIIL